MRVGVNAPATLPRERPGTHCIGGWVAPGPVWTGAENLAPTGIWSRDRLARNKSLYRLSYRGPLKCVNMGENMKIRGDLQSWSAANIHGLAWCHILVEPQSLLRRFAITCVQCFVRVNVSWPWETPQRLRLMWMYSLASMTTIDNFLFECVYITFTRFLFCILLFNSVSYAFLCLCILIDKYALFCILFANWHSPATLTKVFPYVFLSCKANARVYTSQRRGTVRTLPN
jgi:hypothetical protein